MKRFIIVFLLVIFGFSAVSVEAGSSSTDCLNINVNLRQGERDTGSKTEVYVLQGFLNAKGYLKVSPTGFFGAQTLKAVKTFQKDNAITSTGYIGPLTRAFIQKTTCTVVVAPTPPQTIPPVVTPPVPEVVTPPALPVVDEILTAGTASSLKVKTIGIVSSNSSSLVVKGEVTAGARSETVRWFELTTNPLVYKTSQTIVSPKVPQRSNDKFDVSFTGLIIGTNYYYRVCAENIAMSQKICGETASAVTI